ncbi:microsomal triglyceride transfer protein large subunit isoform X1 [Ictalurus furcatus]|uniref:microsomal triglyceride transfer protein large subunit isoform X1 n=1 Tax=Ictalurus furcatus TaxID=66913 RepID=UPI0023504AAF|nr:microsomal triglyceride transfer protein large subunit isoform X1 [Ictalurus furcatus]
MKPSVCLTFCFLFLIGIRDNVSGKVVLSTGLHFDPGVLYEYEYSTSMEVAPISEDFGEATAFTVLATIHIHSLWRNSQQEQLLQLQIQNLKLNPNSSDSTSKPLVLGDMASGSEHVKEPFLVHIHSGKIKGVFDVSSDNTVSLNFKKGLAMLLQIQAQSGTIKEDDTTGQCQVSYHMSGDDIIKVKHHENCEKRMTDGKMFANQFFRVSSGGSSETVFTMDGSHIKSVISEEFGSLVLDEYPTVGIHISSRQLLQLLSTHSGPNEAQGALQDMLRSLKAGYVNHTIHAIPAVRQPAIKRYSVPKILAHLKAKELHTQSTTVNMFLQLSESLRNLEMVQIKNILKKAHANFVPILIDAAAAASTPASLEALVSFINIPNPKTSPLLEKFLYACAFSSQPSTHLINIITHILTHTSAQWETHEMALIVLGTVIRKMCSADMCYLQEVEHAKGLIVKGLSASTEEREIKSYLLALKSARLPETVPVLLQYIDHSKSVSSIVLSALQGFPPQYITKEVKEHARNIFNQRKKSFSVPVRLDAAQLLLMYDPLDIDVQEIILKIAEEKPEVSKFLTTKIMSVLRSDSPARNVIRNVLKDPKLNNYFHLARSGCSSSYAGLMTENKNMLASYDFEFLFSESGAPKQSNSQFYAQTRGRSLHLLQVSLETSGLDSLFGTEATGAEEEELMAGMSAMFLGVQIQPIVFFQGYGDLMSKYFSAGEGPMNIISGNILILDNRQSLILQSGLQAHGVFHGGLSVDVSADLAFSIFTQESKTSVNNKFSLIVSAKAEVDAPLISTTAETVVKMDPSVRFVTTVSFYDTPVQYCLQLIRDPLLYRESVSTRVNIQNRTKLVQRRKQKWTLSGEEAAFNKENSKMCRNLLNPNSK